jgi:hypothetical protein
MDAQTILNLVNKNLKNYLSDYYDNICNEIINNINEKSDGAGMSIEKMKECAAELKPKIVNGDQQPEQPVVEQKKEKLIVEVNGSDIPDRSILSSMKRKDLQALCKAYKIPGRQKNSELIEQLMMKKVDAVDQPVNELQPEPIAPEEPEPEPQPEPKVQKKSTKIIKVNKEKKKVIEIVKEPEPEEEPKIEPEQEEENNDYTPEPEVPEVPEDLEEEPEDDPEEPEDPEDEDKWDDRFFADELQEEEYDEDE